MTLQSNLAALISAVGTDWKALWAKLGTATLTTTATNVSAAINELKAAAIPPAPLYRVGRQPMGTVLTTFQTTHGWTTAGTGGTSNLNDTGDFISGSQSAWIQSGGAAAQWDLRKFGVAIGDTNRKAFRLRIKVDDFSKLDELVFYAGKGSLSTDDFKWSFLVGGGSPYLVAGEWGNVVLSFANATVEGAALREDCTDLQFQIYDNNTGTGTKVHVQSVELIPATHADFPNGVVSFCFDDTWLSPKTLGWTKMDANSYPATLFLIQDYIGITNYLTLQDIKDRTDRYGWEVACHASLGTNHALSQTGMSAAALDLDLKTQRLALEGLGFRGASGYAAPLGQFGKTTDNVSTIDITRRAMSYCRTTHSRTTEVVPPANPYTLRAISGISSFAGGVTASSLTTAGTGKIAKAKAEGAWLIFVFHELVAASPANTGQCLTSDFNAIVDAVAAAGMPVLTIEDVLKTTSS